MNQKYEQLFVIGCPRSGTTFLSKLLSNTRFGKPYETHFIPQILDEFDNNIVLSSAEFKRAFKKIIEERSMRQYAVNVEADKVYNDIEKATLYNLINHLALQATANHKSAWGDKTPWYATKIQQLSDFFPKAKFIYIKRDPRAVTASLLKKDWAPKNAYCCAKLWVDHNSIPSELSRALKSENRLHEVRYEDIVKDPVSCLLDIYSFIGEPKYQIEPESIEQLTKNDNNDKWKTQLSKGDLDAIENVCWEKMALFQYQCINHNFPKISFIKASYFKLQNAILRFIYLVKLNTFHAFLIKTGRKEPFDE